MARVSDNEVERIQAEVSVERLIVAHGVQLTPDGDELVAVCPFHDVRYVQQLLGHAQLDTTAIYTHVSILKLLEVYAATHPAARIGHAPARVKARDEALAQAEAADLLTALDEAAGEDDAVANGAVET